MQNADVLIFVEDPGAANYIAQLPAALSGRGWNVKVLADGYAKDLLLQLGLCPETAKNSTEAGQILSSFNPRVLIVGTASNPDTLGLALVAEARSVKIESIGVVDAVMNSENRFKGRSGKPLTYAPDWLLVADEPTKAAYSAIGYSAERINVCGHPHYDYVRSVRTRLENEGQNAVRQRVLPGVSEERKAVIFATECSARLCRPQPGCLADYTLSGRKNSKGRTEIVLEEFLDAIKLIKPRPHLILRLHPKDVSEDYAQYLDEFDLVSSGGSPFELIYASDLVVGLTTMLMLEAALMGKHTLSIVPRGAEKGWLPSVRAGITPCVTTRKQIRTVLADLLCNNSYKPNNDIGEVFPSGALQRVVDFTEKILECTKVS
ncbi:MAG: hypothetical protein JW947_08725 [Sedimentisphaerales bacterium]|nr:hypothetical protein [Sedimentisphaerales bacterium]